MELMKKVQQLILGLVILLAFGCGKDDDGERPDSNPQTPALRTCRLIKQTADETISDYVYDNAGRLIRINHNRPANTTSNYHQEITYNAAGKTLEVKWFDYQHKHDIKETYVYNSNYLPEKIYDSIMSNGSYYGGSYTELLYNNVNKLIRRNYYQSTGFLESYTEFSYPNANEVKQMVYGRDGAGNMRLEWTYVTQYGSLKHPISLLGFLNTNVLVSEHAPTAGTSTDHLTGATNSFTNSYISNSDGFITEMLNQPQPSKWEYTCQ